MPESLRREVLTLAKCFFIGAAAGMVVLAIVYAVAAYMGPAYPVSIGG